MEYTPHSNAKKYCQYCRMYVYNSKGQIAEHQASEGHRRAIEKNARSLRDDVTEQLYSEGTGDEPILSPVAPERRWKEEPTRKNEELTQIFKPQTSISKKKFFTLD